MDSLPEGSNLVNKFPPFTSISVVDNLYALLWAGILQDIEAAVEEFIMSEQSWDYASFSKIAEERQILLLHRCAFSIFNLSKTLLTPGDGSTRGRHRDQLLAYRTIVNTIFNTAKNVWLEPQVPLPTRSMILDLKRSIAGLYILYYMWHNQIPADKYKVSIKYSPGDQVRAKVVVDIFLKLESQIPNTVVVKNCYKYLVTALSKRNAFSYSHVVHEPKLEIFHWQQTHLENCSMRKTLISVNSGRRFSESVPLLEAMCNVITNILESSRKISSIPTTKSVFFRRIVPFDVIKKTVALDRMTLQPYIKLPVDYSSLAKQITESIEKNVTVIEKPFLTLDALLQTDRAPSKILRMGINKIRVKKMRNEYNKREYEKSKQQFNLQCDRQRAPNLKVQQTRKYRVMKTPAWLFINKQFEQMFPEKESIRSNAADSATIPTETGTSPSPVAAVAATADPPSVADWEEENDHIIIPEFPTEPAVVQVKKPVRTQVVTAPTRASTRNKKPPASRDT